jgi:proteic killer suppression protein
VEFRFASSKLEKLYQYKTGSTKYPDSVVEAFIKRIRLIEGAKDERAFRAFKGIHFEKLRGTRNQYSMRLNKDWRLILRFEKNKEGIVVVIIEINRHYGD